MNWAWAASLDQLWRSPTYPMWLTLAVVGFFGICVLITLLRAEKSIANVALTVITLLALGMAAAETIRGASPAQLGASAGAPALQRASMALPALSCIDDLAGDVVLAACEKTLFGSAENTAAALSYAASQITRLTALGDVATANLSMTPELEMLRGSVERDRYGLMAQVLVTRDHCSPSDCAIFRSLTDHQQVATNMAEGVYDSLIARYAPSWNATPASAPVAMLSSSMPTGKPTNAEFPSAASTPPVSIMTPEPSATSSAAPRPAASSTPPPSAAPAPPRPAAAPAVAATKKPAAKHAASPPQHTPAPVQLSPQPGTPAPETAND
jgi:hypothetical protein